MIFLLLLLVVSVMSQEEAYVEEAQYLPYDPAEYHEAQPRQDFGGQGQNIAAGEWYPVDPAYHPQQPGRSPSGVSINAGFSADFARIIKLSVGGIVFGAIVVFLFKALGLTSTDSPRLKEAMAVIEENIPKEARSIEALMPIARMAFEAIDKYAELNEDIE